MRDLKLAVLIVSALVALASCGGPAGNNPTLNNANKPVASNGNAAPAMSGTNSSSPSTAAIDGKALYTENCKICHQETGKGGPTTINGKKIKPADLTAGHSKKHSDDDLVKDIQEGSPDDGMPAFKEKLKPEEIRAIVGYIRTLQQQ
jgi:mono/diheme cytochrome c family protein